MNKIVCDHCNEPADVLETPNWALYCEVCGNEHTLSFDADSRVIFDFGGMQGSGFAVKNLRRL